MVYAKKVIYFVSYSQHSSVTWKPNSLFPLPARGRVPTPGRQPHLTFSIGKMYFLHENCITFPNPKELL